MRFSDTFLRQLRDRVSIADYAGRRLAWDKRKSRPAAGDFWACCPFHTEKSASFHVLDAKGIFNCFGCGEKGDVFTLAMRLEGLSFPEAVAKMAEQAGMALPVDEHEDRAQGDHRKRLLAITARTALFYGEALRAPAGAAAREYLRGRGLGPEEWARFGIGYAPGGWTWTIEKLRGDGFELGEIIDAGVARAGEAGERAIDVFRERVMFEINDPAGKVIAFGGRSLDPQARAKYLNSPECELFHKGATLYRLKQAREILAKTKAGGLVIAEGYLDVVAFERSGIAAVAPLGTALTEPQLLLAWRSGEPVLCFDGDGAGKRAAERAIDVALPHIGPGRTVKIASTPAGEDPDDVFRRLGADALKGVIGAAMPASEALFERERARAPLETPEARAGLKARLREAAQRIADAETRRLYLSDLLGRADALFRPPRNDQRQGAQRWERKDGQRWRGPQAPQPATPELRAMAALPTSRPAAEAFLCAAVDLPGVRSRFSDWIDRLAIADPELEAIRGALFALSHVEDPIDRAALSLHLTQLGQGRAAARVLRWPRPGATDAGADLEAEWLAQATREIVLPAIREELAQLRPLVDSGDDAAFARFQALALEVRAIEARAREAKQDDAGQEETGEALPDHLVA